MTIREWVGECSEGKSLWRMLIIFWSLLVFSYLIRNEEPPSYVNPLWVVSHGIHEIGHWVARPFGMWVSVAAGSIFEFLFPFVFVVGMLKAKDLHGAFVLLTWSAAGLLHTAHYAGSAEYSGTFLETPFHQQLYHDWVWMLSRLDAIPQARNIEDVFFYMAIFFCLVSIFGQTLSLYFIWKKST